MSKVGLKKARKDLMKYDFHRDSHIRNAKKRKEDSRGDGTAIPEKRKEVGLHPIFSSSEQQWKCNWGGKKTAGDGPRVSGREPRMNKVPPGRGLQGEAENSPMSV